MSETARTLELTWLAGSYRISIPNYLKLGERVKLVEAEPVADLLERLSKFFEERYGESDLAFYVEVEALLRVLRPEGQA